ncbi:MAG: hypothetical protein V7K32_21525 [Nostoc sp.]|uniref:hypothetical protein n=1 Tax=Nostoc sp. TaxID=1180 RepID=UPI002FF9B368
MLNFILIVIQPILQFKSEYVFYILGILSLIVGIFFSSKPVFVPPMESLRIKGSDAHDVAVHLAFFIGFFCISLAVTLKIFNILGDRSLFIWLCIGVFFISLIILFVFIVILSIINQRNSLRPIYCERCQQKLRLINNSLIDFLDEKEIIAMRIKSICFEAWYCQSCSSKIERNSIHLRAYVSLSDNFKLCQDCNELTMTKTSKIVRKATTKEEGIKSIVYTCNCCHKKEEKIEKIPIIQQSDM